ncbi:hypothetical protein MTO96_008206 [Rhipicephalus appendiculatus]
MSEKRTKSVAQTEHCVVPDLAKHQQRTEERDNDLPVSNMSMVAETPSTKPSSETARRKKNRKKKRSSEHRKKGPLYKDDIAVFGSRPTASGHRVRWSLQRTLDAIDALITSKVMRAALTKID